MINPHTKNKFKLQEGKKYKLQNNLIVTMIKSKPFYKALIISPNNSKGYYEYFNEHGIAYHDDCQLNVIEEIN